MLGRWGVAGGECNCAGGTRPARYVCGERRGRCGADAARHEQPVVQVQQVLKRDPHVGDHYVLRGKRGHLIKSLRHPGIGMSLCARVLRTRTPLRALDIAIGLNCDFA